MVNSSKELEFVVFSWADYHTCASLWALMFVKSHWTSDNFNIAPNFLVIFFFFLVDAGSSCNPKNPHTSESFDPYERDAVDPRQVLMTPLSQSSGTVELPKKRTNTPKPGPNLLIRTQFALKSFLLLYFSFLLHVILDQVIFCPVKLCSCFNDTHTHLLQRRWI